MFLSRKPRPKDPPRAIVLGGGGSKGAYQIGVWQALEEHKYSFQVVTGTSVGALNGALMAQGSLEEAYDLWWNLDNSQVVEDIPNVEDHPDSLLGVYRAYLREALRGRGADTTPLQRQIQRVLDEERLRASGVAFGITTVDMTTLKPVQLFLDQMPPGTVADYLMASASFFPALRPTPIGDGLFVDGGYYDNIPIDMALAASVPVEEVLAVDVDGPGFVRPVKTQVPVKTLRSYWDLGSILVFDNSQIRRNIRLGYLDGLKELGKLEGRAYAFRPGTLALLEAEYLEEMTQAMAVALEGLSGRSRGGIDKLLADRLTGSLSHRRRVATPGEVLAASAETAAELLDLDPREIYTLDTFEDTVLAALAASRQGLEEGSLSLDQLRGMALTQVVQGVREKGRELLLQTVLSSLRQHFSGEEPGIPTEMIALLAPREFLAALYLLLLERRTL